MKRILKCLSFLLTFLIVGSGLTYGEDSSNNLSVASNQINTNIYTQSIPDSAIKFAKDKFQFFMQGAKNNTNLIGVSQNDIKSIYLGQGFNVYSINDNKFLSQYVYCFPLILNGQFKAILTVSLNPDGTYSASLGKDFCDNLNKLLQYNTKENPFIVYSSDNELIAENSNSSLALHKDEINSKSLTISPLKAEKTDFREMIKNSNISTVSNLNDKLANINLDIYNNSKITQNSLTSSPYSNQLNVPFVSQNGNPDCWAASVACIVNYKTGRSLSAIDVCNQMGVHYNGPFAGDDRDHSNSLRAFNYYGVPAHLHDQMCAFQTIQTYINEYNDPIYMISIDEQDLTTNHATVCYGWIASDQGQGIMVMDGNNGFRELTSGSNIFSMTEVVNGKLNTFQWNTSLLLNHN